jgi:hypothetical protein
VVEWQRVRALTGEQRSEARSTTTSACVAPPHLDGAVGGGGEEAAVGVVDEHGVDGPVVREKGVDAGAVGELPRLDGLVVGGRVQQGRHGVEHEAGHGVAVLAPPALAACQLVEEGFGRERGGLLGADVVARGGGAHRPDADVVVAAVGGHQRAAAGRQGRHAPAPHVQVPAVEAARRGPGAHAAAVGRREEHAAGHGQRVHVAIQAVQCRQAMVDGGGRRRREPHAPVERRLPPGRAPSSSSHGGHLHPRSWHGRHRRYAQASRRAPALAAAVVLLVVYGRARARARRLAVVLEEAEALATPKLHPVTHTVAWKSARDREWIEEEEATSAARLAWPPNVNRRETYINRDMCNGRRRRRRSKYTAGAINSAPRIQVKELR